MSRNILLAIATAGVTVIITSLLWLVYQTSGGSALLMIITVAMIAYMVVTAYSRYYAMERIYMLIDKLELLLSEIKYTERRTGIPYTMYSDLAGEAERTIEYLQYCLDNEEPRDLVIIYDNERREVDDLICSFLNEKDEFEHYLNTLQG